MSDNTFNRLWLSFQNNWNHKYGKIFTLAIIPLVSFLMSYSLFKYGPWTSQIALIAALTIGILSYYVPKLSIFIFFTLTSITLLFTSSWIALFQFIIGLIYFIFVNSEHNKRLRVLVILLIPFCVAQKMIFLPIFLAVYLLKTKAKDISLFLGIETALWGTIYGNITGFTPLAKYNQPIKVKNLGDWLTQQFKLLGNNNTKFLTSWLNSNLVAFFVMIVGTVVLIVITSKVISKCNQSKAIKEIVLGIVSISLATLMITFISYNVNQKLVILPNLSNTFFTFVLAYIISLLIINTEVTGESLSEQSKIVVSKGKHGWDSISGYEDVKLEIKDAILPYVNSSVKKQMINSNIPLVKGILLYGPPGVGKTLFAKAIAAESKMKFISVNGSEFSSKYVGESEENLRKIFAEARQNSPCVIFFDELESFLRPRSETKESWEKSIVTTFLAEMDGFNELKDVLIIGATNHPDKIDSAAIRPGRFDKIIFLPPPDEAARKAIWEHYLKGRKVHEKIDVTTLVEKSYRFTAADIAGIVNEAYRMNKYKPINTQMLLALLENTKPTVTLDMLDYYEKLAQKYGRRSHLTENKEIKERKKYNWDDIAGMTETKQRIKQEVELPFLNPELFEQYKIRPTKGVLLYGPPGCGKTLLAKVLSDECAATYFSIKGPELLTAGQGESEEKIRRLFRDARESKPAIIFFDEIDSIAEKRGDNSDSARIVNQLLTEMDGTEGMEKIIVVAATNRPDRLDSALLRPGRFDSIIYVGIPDKASREAQLKYHLKDRPFDLNLDDLVQLTEGYTGAELEYIVNQTAFIVVQDVLKGNSRPITIEDFKQIINKTPHSITKEDLQNYEELKRMQR